MNKIFDRELLKHNQIRFSKNFAKSDFLFKEISDRTIENILFFKENFDKCLEIGAKDGYLGQNLLKNKKTKEITQTNLTDSFNENLPKCLIMDDEFLDFNTDSFDLIINNLNFHFNNEIPKLLLKTKEILKDKGVYVNFFFGGETLKELREVFYEIDQKTYGGIGPRLIPFIDVKDAGALAQKTGFQNIISDSQKIEISYSSILKLLQDIRNMSLSNILIKRNKKPITKKMLFLMENLIKELYPASLNKNNDEFVVNFEIITITAFN